ncbi:MAG: radical SAM protein [Elusimicrobiota bacterium]
MSEYYKMSDRKKILLLNPPGKKLYIRDYYCSKVSQADYVYHPIDLLVQSGILFQEFEPVLIDAIIEKFSGHQILEKIAALKVSGVVALAGSVSWEEDISFFNALKEQNKVPLVVSGDVFREGGENILKLNPSIDAIILDFTNTDALNFFKGNFDRIENATFRSNGEIKSVTRDYKPGEFSIPLPRHEIFTGRNYRYPFVREKVFSTILADFGCPFNCSFCIMAELPFKWRNPGEIVIEIKYLNSLGIKEFFLATQTFGANKKMAQGLCEQIIRENISCGWTCFSRVDVVNEELLKLMKQAGCHTIIFGVESGDEKILKEYRKQYTVEQIKNTLQTCERLGIETVATFILGLPEEDSESIEKTIKLAKSLPIDYASFNVAVPRMGTEMRDDAIMLGLVDQNKKVMDQSGSEVAMPTKKLTRKQVDAYRRKAVFSFYFRPSYILNRLLKLKDIKSFTRQIKQAIALVRQTWLNK